MSASIDSPKNNAIEITEPISASIPASGGDLSLTTISSGKLGEKERLEIKYPHLEFEIVDGRPIFSSPEVDHVAGNVRINWAESHPSHRGGPVLAWPFVEDGSSTVFSTEAIQIGFWGKHTYREDGSRDPSYQLSERPSWKNEATARGFDRTIIEEIEQYLAGHANDPLNTRSPAYEPGQRYHSPAYELEQRQPQRAKLFEKVFDLFFGN